MMDIASLKDISLLRESVDLEVKLARGADGKGAIPKDFWPTYSAFANTHGGVIVLGLREHKGEFLLEGVDDPDKLRSDLFNTLDSGKVSCNPREAVLTSPSASPTPEMVSHPSLHAKTPRPSPWGERGRVRASSMRSARLHAQTSPHPQSPGLPIQCILLCASLPPRSS